MATSVTCGVDIAATIGQTWPMLDRTIDVPALVALRADRGMTMAELARTSGVSYNMIKKVHARQVQFSDITALRIARALGCHPNDFSTPKAITPQEGAA
jgi:DNA-binding Xre family transcriptional regulator